METREPVGPSPEGSVLHRRPGVSAAWGGPFVLGLLLFILGIIAVYEAAASSVVSVLLYGSLLVVGGVVEFIQAFRVRKVGGPFLLYFLGGILTAVVGLLVLSNPGAGLAALTLLIAGYFFVSGLFHAITSVMDRYPGWGGDLFYGLCAVLAGIIIMAQFPVSAFWVVGTFVGAVIIARGAALMAASLMVRRGLRALTT